MSLKKLRISKKDFVSEYRKIVVDHVSLTHLKNGFVIVDVDATGYLKIKSKKRTRPKSTISFWQGQVAK